MRDLVVISLEGWDGVWRRNQHLLNGLLEKDPTLRVLFVEPAADPVHTAKRRSLPRLGAGLKPVEAHEGSSWDGRLWSFQPTKWLPRRIDPRADMRLAKSVLRAAARLGMTHPVLWVNDPFGAEVVRLTGWRSLYDITDDWLLADRSTVEDRRLVRQEGYLMQACEEVVVCSPQLQRDKGALREVHLVPNAVDLAAYNQDYPRPIDLPHAPVVLYVGTLHRDRLDMDLCLDLARRLRGRAKLVFVGPVALDANDSRRLEDSDALLLGPRQASTIPAYLQHADVLVVPHVVTPFTESLDPIKAYEYQAAGRPVVSTQVPGFRDSDSALVRCASSSEEFASHVLGLLEPSASPTQTPDEVPDWDVRVEAMAGILGQIFDSRK